MLRRLTTVLAVLAIPVFALGAPLCCVVDVGASCCHVPAPEQVEPERPTCCSNHEPKNEPSPEPAPTPRCECGEHTVDLSVADHHAAPPVPAMAVAVVVPPVAQSARVALVPEVAATPPRAVGALSLPLLL